MRRGMFGAKAAATPRVTAGSSARSRCRAVHRGPTAATSTRWWMRWPPRWATTGYAAAIERVVVFRDELTLEVRREHLPAVAQALRDDPGCGSSYVWGSSGCTIRRTPTASCTRCTRSCRSPTTVGSGWRSPPPTPIRTSRRCSRVYPTTDWHERETYDFFGIIFDGHPRSPASKCPMTGWGIRNARTTRWAASPWNTTARRYRRPTSGGPTTDEADHAAHRPTSGGTDTVVMVGGQDWDEVVAAAARARAANASSSTWARSTRPPTACCG